ncbi:MAG: [acyl-carrier-protein] S-malonyltransferase [Desulfobulbus propionicus]|nr:MAG: [acyl-carrier-protein] S-malonyltransferase [Desulfobulbus propionicus]
MKKTAILFPGQGSQYVGMGAPFLDDVEAAELLERAEKISGYPLVRLTQEGPLEELTRGIHLQPALTAINLICWQQLQKRLPGFKPVCSAGHSLGEYSALFCAGVFAEDDALRLVTRRGELMEREGTARPGGMHAVLGLDIATIERLLNEYEGEGVVVVANHNTPQQIVISGDEKGLEGLGALCREEGGKCIPLPVSLANHSPLVAGAVEDFRSFIDTVEVHPPALPVFFNITASTEQRPDEIRRIMAEQVVSRVRWVDSIAAMVDAGVEIFVELGPKSVLTGMMKKLLPRKSGIVCLQADTPDAMDRVARAIAA